MIEYSVKSVGTWVILASFGVAFTLEIMPLPAWAIEWRPAWVVMTLIYWVLALPLRIGVVAGWSVGLLHDVLADTLMGQYALSYTLVAYIVRISCRQIRVFPVWQQSMVVFVLILLSELPGAWVRGMLGYGNLNLAFVYPAVTSVFLWHWIFVLLRDLRRHYRISDEN